MTIYAPTMLSTEEVANILQVTPKTLYLWRAAGKGPTFAKIGRKILYPMEAVKDFINENIKKEVQL